MVSLPDPIPAIDIRPILASDGPIIAEFYESLTPRDSWFFYPHPLDDENARKLAADNYPQGTVVVADGARLTQWEGGAARAASAPASVDQLIKVLNQSRRGNRLYVRLVTRDMGATVNGETMPALPSSVLAVMQGDRGGSANASMQVATLGS